MFVGESWKFQVCRVQRKAGRERFREFYLQKCLSLEVFINHGSTLSRWGNLFLNRNLMWWRSSCKSFFFFWILRLLLLSIRCLIEYGSRFLNRNLSCVDWFYRLVVRLHYWLISLSVQKSFLQWLLCTTQASSRGMLSLP